MSGSGEKAVRERARADASVVNGVLSANGVGSAGSVIAAHKKVGGRVVWTVHSPVRLELWKDDVPGRWSLKLDLTYDVDALSGIDKVFLHNGSIGLQWTPFNQGSECSFVRYDVDIANAISIGEPCHLHVLQAEKLNDRLHFRLPAVGIQEWPVGPTVEFLCSETLRDEIGQRLE